MTKKNSDEYIKKNTIDTLGSLDTDDKATTLQQNIK